MWEKGYVYKAFILQTRTLIVSLENTVLSKNESKDRFGEEPFKPLRLNTEASILSKPDFKLPEKSEFSHSAQVIT